MLRNTQKLISLILSALHLAAGLSDGVCPTYVVQPGDTISSIASANALEATVLTASMKACGQSLDTLMPGKTVCLPGAELPGCTNVRIQNGKRTCKYYIMQAGDSIASVANDLNMYQQDLITANPSVAAVQGILVGQLLKLPPWNDTACGDLGLFEGRPPVKSPPPISPPPEAADNTDSEDDNEQLPPSGETNPNLTGIKCRGFRVRDGDDLYSIAALFNVDISLLVDVNPDLGSGKPVDPGTIVKIPPYDNTCTTPMLITAEELALVPVPATEQSTTTGSPPPDENKPTPTNNPITRPPQSNLPSEITTVPDGDDPQFNSTDTFGRDDSIAGNPTIIQNIVVDGVPAAPKGDNPNTGNIIMILSLVFAGAMIFGLLGFAFSGAGVGMSGKKFKKNPEENPNGVV